MKNSKTTLSFLNFNDEGIKSLFDEQFPDKYFVRTYFQDDEHKKVSSFQLDWNLFFIMMMASLPICKL
jgi:hypothetical protein